MSSKGGRPPLKIPEPRYLAWLKAGCPALELSVAQLAGWLEPAISRQRVNEFVKREDLIKEGKVIRTAHPVNLAWLRSREGAEPPSYSPGRRGFEGEEQRRREAPDRPADGRVVQNQESAGLDIGALDMDAILDAIERADLTLFRKADIDKIAKLETAAKTRADRMAKLGLLIDRRLVSSFTGRLYQVDTDQIKPLGMKLSADLGAAFGVEDPASILLIQQTIDEETSKILAHIKRLMNDFLVGVGEPPVEDDFDPLAELIESTANMLRGMALDPAIPPHAKEAMRARIRQLEAAVASE